MPLLIPSGFCRALGMILDATTDTATWTKLGGKASKVHILPSEHMAINLLEFPKGGWANPYDNNKNLRIGNGESKSHVPRKEFELESTTCVQQSITSEEQHGIINQDVVLSDQHGFNSDTPHS